MANKDQRPGDYGSTRHAPRPSHADYTYIAKYGTHSSSGGGRSSARETVSPRQKQGCLYHEWGGGRRGQDAGKTRARHDTDKTHTTRGADGLAPPKIGRVAGGAIAEKWLQRDYGIEIVAYVSSVGEEELEPGAVDLDGITREEVVFRRPPTPATRLCTRPAAHPPRRLSAPLQGRRQRARPLRHQGGD